MKLRQLLFSFSGSSLLNLVLADPPLYVTTPGGIIVYTDQQHERSAIPAMEKSKPLTLNKSATFFIN